MFTLITPTMWRPAKIFTEFLKDLVEIDIISEIIIIDNDNTKRPENNILSHPKIKIFDFGRNIYVNPAWNFGVKIAKNELVCLLSDDIIFDTRIFYRIAKIMDYNIGSIGLHHGEVKLNQIPVTTGIINIIPNIENVDHLGYGCLMFIKKSEWRDIPESLEIFCGDAFIFDRSLWTGRKNYIITDMMHITNFATTTNEVAHGFLDRESPLYEDMKKRFYEYVLPNKKILKDKLLVDCFTVNDDLDLLEKRLELLSEKVDKFILIESNLSSSGQKKSRSYYNNKLRFKKYADKIMYIPCIFDDTKSYTEQEVKNLKNNYLIKSLDLLIYDFYIMFGDIDEIPNIDIIEQAKEKAKNEPVRFLMDHLYHGQNLISEKKYQGTLLTTKEHFKKSNFDQTIVDKNSVSYIDNGGWKLDPSNFLSHGVNIGISLDKNNLNKQFSEIFYNKNNEILSNFIIMKK